MLAYVESTSIFYYISFIYNKMYTRQQIEKLIPNSEETLDELYEKYNDITWIQYLYLDEYSEDYYIAISNKGDIIYTTHYVGIFMPDKASLIVRRFDYQDIEILEDELFIGYDGINTFNKQGIRGICNIVDKKIRQKVNINNIF
jgi:hypothetical protein